MFSKNTWDAVKAFFEAMRIPLVILVLVLLYNYPGKIKEFIEGAGFRVREINAFGVRLEEAAADLEGTSQKLDQVTAELAGRDQLLREIAAQTPDPSIRLRVQTTLAEGDAITMSALAAASQAAITAAAITESLQTPTQAAPPSGPAPTPVPSAAIGGFLIVFGADLDVAAALHEIGRVRRDLGSGDGGFALFKKGSFYRSAAVFAERAARDAAVDALTAAAGRAVEPVSLDRWCPAARPAPEIDAGDVPVYQC